MRIVTSRFFQNLGIYGMVIFMKIQLKKLIRSFFPRITELLRWAMKASSFSYCYHRRKNSLVAIAANTTSGMRCDSQLVDRLVESYLRRADEMSSGQWAEIFLDRHGDIHTALVTNDRPQIE
jgi:hypothetical protein